MSLSNWSLSFHLVLFRNKTLNETRVMVSTNVRVIEVNWLMIRFKTLTLVLNISKLKFLVSFNNLGLSLDHDTAL